jgi:CDP-diacylglycerol--glycerol-3-phosphate 3-phosphatidyltransferase
MTLATKITILRISLIPVFAGVAWWYGRTVAEGQPQEWMRIGAAGVFIFAATTDGVDGFIARHFNQRSQLGSILDPIADKGLVLVAITVLALGDWTDAFPPWFPQVVIARETLLFFGFVFLTRTIGHVPIRPSWIGKAATACQILAILWVVMRVTDISSIYCVILATALTVASGLGYLMDGIRQLRLSRSQHS